MQQNDKDIYENLPTDKLSNFGRKDGVRNSADHLSGHTPKQEISYAIGSTRGKGQDN